MGVFISRRASYYSRLHSEFCRYGCDALNPRLTRGSLGEAGAAGLRASTNSSTRRSSSARTDVDAMFDSLQQLRALGDDVVIYPGHGYSGDRTTVGKEKVSGLLRPFSREQ